MNLMLLYWKQLALAALLVGGMYKVWDAGGDHVQAKWDKVTAEQVATQLTKNQADQAKLKQLQEKSNVESQDNLRLRANNHALFMRLPKAPCGGSSQTGDTTAGAGELPTQSERDLAEAKRQLDDEALRADEIVRACRVLNDFVK
jgi:small-conductance mechanosensitive channel